MEHQYLHRNPLICGMPSDTLDRCADIVVLLGNLGTIYNSNGGFPDSTLNASCWIAETVAAALRYESARSTMIGE